MWGGAPSCLAGGFPAGSGGPRANRVSVQRVDERMPARGASTCAAGVLGDELDNGCRRQRVSSATGIVGG